MMASSGAVLWSEDKAQLALSVLDKRIAGIFRQESKRPSFVFVELLDQQRVLSPNGEIVSVRETVGDCSYELGRIRLVIGPHWAVTAVHELVHLYNRGRTERWVKRRVAEVCRLLVQGGLWSPEVG